MSEILLNTPNIVFCIIICVSKIIEQSLGAVKTVFLVKGNRTLAALFAFMECMVWGVVVSGIIKDLNSHPLWLAAYCIGYSMGFYIGSFIGGKIQIGTMSVQAIIPVYCEERVREYLTENNFGYFITACEGSKGENRHLTLILPKKKVKEIRKHLTEICNGEIFILNLDVSYYKGGFGATQH